MPNQEIDNNEIEDSNNVNLSETAYNLYMDALVHSCSRVKIEYSKNKIKITGENCGCHLRL